jgi:insulysin
LVKYVPVKDEDYLEIRWYVEYLKPYYKNCPGGYISHLIGHEGENSLLSLLIKEGLALGI